jgi:hypothetical protein
VFTDIVSGQWPGCALLFTVPCRAPNPWWAVSGARIGEPIAPPGLSGCGTRRVPLRFTLTSSVPYGVWGFQYPLPPADGDVPDWGWLPVTGLPDVLRTYQVPPKLVMP